MDIINVLSTNNPIIINFYKKFPNIDFEKMNIFFVQIMENLFSEISTNTNEVTALLKGINQNIINLQEEKEKQLSNQLNQFRSEYTRDIKMIIDNNNHNGIKPILSEYNNTQLSLNNKISEILQKFQGSSNKGRYSETAIYNLLVGIYGERNLKIVSNTPESGDILLIRNNKPVILIENKEYTNSVDLNEVTKFIRDVNTQNCSGILMSQNSKISNKKDFEINFHQNNVTVYLANVKYDTDIIEIAISVIDTITKILPETDTDSDSDCEKDYQLDKEQLDIINQEFNNFMLNKAKHIKTIKDFNKTLLKEVEDFQLPILNGILSMVYGSAKSSEFTCEICGNNYKNKGSLASHKKKHDREKQKQQENQNICQEINESSQGITLDIV
jgi:23S rRNA pseudoU1915 N3-methylase RlmH